MSQLAEAMALLERAALGLVKRPIHVRTLYNKEPLPSNIPHCLPSQHPKLQYDWIWLAEDSGGSPLAMLIAAPCQNIIWLIRIAASEFVPASVLVPLLRKSLADMVARGYDYYGVALDPERPAEAALLRILKRSGGVVTGKGVIAGGLTNIGRL